VLFGEGAAPRPGATRAGTAAAAPGTVLLRIPAEQVRAAVTEKFEGKSRFLAPPPSATIEPMGTTPLSPSAGDGDVRAGAGVSVDDLLDRAVSAINRGDRAVATALAGQVLAVDDGNAEAEDLLAAPINVGEIRRLTILFADLVDSTVLSTKLEPETYRLLVGRYREQVLRIAGRYEGHVGSKHGDGLLVVFGHPKAHENDVYRAVQAGLEITRDVARLSEQAKRRFGAQINVRVGVHRGLVYLDTAEDDVYGLAANLAARVSGLAPPNAVVVSDSVEPLIRNAFEVETLPAAPVKGVEGLINHFRVTDERADASRATRGPLVGRDRELARLRKSWSRAQSGTLTTPGLAFRGEAGIGKSRLAAAAIEMVERDGGGVVELVGSPLQPDAGLHPVRMFLERRCRFSRHTDPAQRLQLLHSELTAHGLDPSAEVPLLAPVVGITPEHGYDPVPAEGRKLQALIADAVQRYLQACLEDASGLVVAEDVHWFDPATIEVLGALLDATGGRLLAVLTGRDGSWLSGAWPVKVFDLTPLSDEQSEALIVALDPTVTADECASVRGRCDGMPFYIEQVVSGLRQPGTENTPTVPDPLYEPLFARLLASPNVVPVVEAAAVIGRHVEGGLLLAVSGLSEDDLDDVVDELEDASVLEPWGSDSWRFRHELLREVASELAPPTLRRELHGRVGDALVEGAAGDPDWRLVATHFQHAERYTDAASAHQQASIDARRRGALEEARTYLTRAISQLESAPAGRDRDRREIAPRLERGFLAAAAEGYQSPSVVADFERCLQLAGTDLRDDQLFATLVALCSYYLPRADLDRAAQVLELLLTGADQERRWFRPAIESGFGMLAFQRGEFAIARGHFEQAIAGLPEDDEHHIEELWFIPDDPIALAYEHLAMDRVFHGDLPGAEAQLRNAARRADELGFPQGPYNHVYAVDIEILMRTEAGQFDRAGALVANLLEQAERYGFDFWQMFGLTEQCLVDSAVLLSSADRDPAALETQIATMTGFVELWRSVGLYAYQTEYDSMLGHLLTAAGRPDEARARVDIALHIAEDTGMHYYDAELLRARAHTYSDPDARAVDLAGAIELARRQGAPLFELRAALDDFELRGGPARAVLVDAAARLPSDSALPEVARAQALLG
jgi:class 3 adenylate cyclase/tetratricopeptide (TPR) repeat protein